MMHIGTTCLFLAICLFTTCHCKNTSVSCRAMYEKGVEAYLDNKFNECVLFIEEALETYREYNKKLQNCRLQCHQEADRSDPLYSINIENLRFYEKIIRNTLCILNCRNKDRDSFEEYNLDEDVVRKFEKREPYEYLHICYFQINDVQKASSAAFTYLVKHPNDEAVITNLKHYATLPGVIMDDVINYEAKDYVYLYVRGANAYEAKRWKEVIQYMEESLASYLQSEEECRVQCEGPYDQGWFPDFIPSVANHFTRCLRCKRNCKSSLNSLNGEKHDDLFESHYHYLQYAYFKVGNLKAACEAVSSYLLFDPLDESMLYNMEYYKQMPKHQDNFFRARPEALHYYHRDKYEGDLMQFITSAFSKDLVIQKEGEYRGLHVSRKKRDRFVIDDFISEESCLKLFNVATKYSLDGDGYEGTNSPHTVHEHYSGVSLDRLGLLVRDDVMDARKLDLVLEISQMVKRTVVKQFRVRNKLYFTFTHLVCRAGKDSGMNRTDLSHAVHADNCNLQDDSSCPKKSPAFTWRDFTAILYLNRGFSGGELFFSGDPFGVSVEKIIEPTCGRVVSFTSGKENLHGVRAVKNGTRCALAIWFTHDKKHYEWERILLSKIYKRIT